MAINPIKLLTAPSAQATNNSLIVTVFGNIDCSRVYEGTSVQIAGYNVVEGVSGTAPDGNGESTITLRYVWPEDTTTGRLTAWNTFEGLGNAIQRAKDIVEQTAGIESLAINGLVNKIGDADYETVPITDKGKELLASDDTSVLRAALDLGNAAVATVTESNLDTTSGRLLKVNDFGLGTVTIDGNSPLYISSVQELDEATVPSIYRVEIPSMSGVLEVLSKATNRTVQRFTELISSTTYVKTSTRVSLDSGVTWSDWDLIASAANNSLIEYGSNANGSYTKFPDGTIYMWILSLASSSSEDSLWTYPHPLVEAATPRANARSASLNSYSVNFFNIGASTEGAGFNVLDSNDNRVFIGVGLSIIGRWK